MPWRSEDAHRRAVRGCFYNAGKSPAKRAKCRKMAGEDVNGNPKRKKNGRRKRARRRS